MTNTFRKRRKSKLSKVYNSRKRQPKRVRMGLPGACHRRSKVVEWPLGDAREALQRLNNERFACALCALAYGSLESCTANAQNMPHSARDWEGVEVAKHRLRICVGYRNDGEPIVKHISGDSEFDLADKVVKEYVKSGRIAEFLEGASAQVGNCSVSFKDYTLKWYSTYKAPKLKPTTASEAFHLTRNCGSFYNRQ